MKNKGFTLVELLAVIVILAILAGIAVPATTSISTTIRTNSYCTKIDNLLKDAVNYYNDKVDDFTDTCYASVTVQDLVDSGNAKEDSTINPIDNSSLTDKSIMVYKKDSRLYAYWGDDTDTTYSSSCESGTTVDHTNLTSACTFSTNNENQNVGSTVKITWTKGADNPRGSAYFNLSLNAVVTSTSAVASAKYCITTDENCTPDKTVDAPSNSMSINLPANGGTPQKMCMKATTVIGDLSNTVCSDLYKVDNTDINFSWSVAGSSSSLVNGWYRTLSLTGTTTGKVQSAKYCVKTNSSCTPDTSASLNGNTFNVPVSQNASAQTACATITDIYDYTTSPKCYNTSVKVDSSAPTTTWTVASSTSGKKGWYTGITLQANLSDSISGVASSKYCIATSACTPTTNATINNNTYDVAIPNGSNQEICTNTTDNAGNTSDTICSTNYNIDNVGPNTSITASVVQTTNITITATGTDDTSKIAYYEYSKDGSTYYSSTASTYTFSGFTDGTYTLYAKAVDNAGNVGNTATATAKIVTGPLTYTTNGNTVTLNYDYIFKDVSNRYGTGIYEIFLNFSNRNQTITTHDIYNGMMLYAGKCSEESDSSDCETYYHSTKEFRFSIGSNTVNRSPSASNGTSLENHTINYFTYYESDGTVHEYVKVFDSISVTYNISSYNRRCPSTWGADRICTDDIHVVFSITIVNPTPVLSSFDPYARGEKNIKNFEDPASSYLTNMAVAVYADWEDQEGQDNSETFGPQQVDISEAIKSAIN